MSITLEMSNDVLPNWDPRVRGDQTIGSAVRAMLGNQMMRLQVERRREQRYPYPYPIRLTPVWNDKGVAVTESVMVLGKHLSEHGVDFYYTEPLAYRRAIASFERGGREVLHMMMELTWCRFGRHGWYENGGRFLHVVGSEMAAAGTWPCE
jgi:hypothetical protein